MAAVKISEVIRETANQFLVDWLKGCPDFTKQASLDTKEIIDVCLGDNRRCPRAGLVFKCEKNPTIPVTKYSPPIPTGGEFCRCTLQKNNIFLSKINAVFTEKSVL